MSSRYGVRSPYQSGSGTSPLQISATAPLSVGGNTVSLNISGGLTTVPAGLSTNAASNSVDISVSWSAVSALSFSVVNVSTVASTGGSISSSGSTVTLKPGYYDVSYNFCLQTSSSAWLCCGAMLTSSSSAGAYSSTSDVVALRSSGYQFTGGGALMLTCRSIIIVGGSSSKYLYFYVGGGVGLPASGAGPGFVGGPPFTSSCSIVQIA